MQNSRLHRSRNGMVPVLPLPPQGATVSLPMIQGALDAPFKELSNHVRLTPWLLRLMCLSPVQPHTPLEQPNSANMGGVEENTHPECKTVFQGWGMAECDVSFKDLSIGMRFVGCLSLLIAGNPPGQVIHDKCSS